MQKLTIFSVLLSISVVLIVVDTVSHDYLNVFEEIPTEEELKTQIDLPDENLEPDETMLNEVNEQFDEDSVDLSDESSEPEKISSSLNLEIFENADFTRPVLKDTLYSGLIFQFISFSDQSDATVYQWNLFDGEQYLGSIYEIKYPTETGSFQGYLAMRERSMSMNEIGSVNEVNNYGDASFYFNHKTKIKTVHLIIRTGSNIYAFDYAQSNHEKMKKVFDSIAPVL